MSGFPLLSFTTNEDGSGKCNRFVLQRTSVFIDMQPIDWSVKLAFVQPKNRFYKNSGLVVSGVQVFCICICKCIIKLSYKCVVTVVHSVPVCENNDIVLRVQQSEAQLYGLESCCVKKNCNTAFFPLEMSRKTPIW